MIVDDKLPNVSYHQTKKEVNYGVNHNGHHT